VPIQTATFPCGSPTTFPTVELGPVTVSAANLLSTLEYTQVLIHGGGRHFFCFCEASLFSNLLSDAGLARLARKATVVLPDGIALIALARLHGHRLPTRVPGPSFLLAAVEYGLERGWRHFFYGGAPDVADRLAAYLQRTYPGVVIAGTLTPPFRPLTDAEDQETKVAIESTRPDLLWVCLGSPKQERWCAEHVGRIDVPVMLPVGAAFDFHAGSRPWAPAWIRNLGMEWAFRTLTGGRRTFLRNLRCVSIVGLYMLKVILSSTGRILKPRQG
jgi:N-acetylglucosaminyldiphosphoundecaprenol N-acetyl-beta-D-mannosaminyltransferase